MAVATPTDHPTLVHNRCEIDLFGDVFEILLSVVCVLALGSGLFPFPLKC